MPRSLRLGSIALVVLIVGLLVAWWSQRSAPAPSAPGGAPAVHAPPPAPLPQVKKPRVVLPRPPPKPLAARTEVAEAAAKRPELVDRRPPAEQDGGGALARLRPHLDAVDESVAECIGAWMEVDPSLKGDVMLGFRLGPEGLQEAWVDDHTEVPAGPLSCFAAAVYDEDWAGAVVAPAEVTLPFKFDGQAGPAVE